MSTKFKTWVNAEPTKNKEPGGGESLTEQSGYVPPNIRIREMVMAGVRLNEYRKEQFDGLFTEVEGEKIDWNKIPVTRRSGVDLVDVMNEYTEINRRIELAKANAAKRIKDKYRESIRKEVLEEVEAKSKPPVTNPPEGQK